MAPHALANGASDILAAALDAGYGSHEAFTRAFRDQFGVTPESVRALGQLDRIDLVEAIAMDQRPLDDLPPPRMAGQSLDLSKFTGMDDDEGQRHAHDVLLRNPKCSKPTG